MFVNIFKKSFFCFTFSVSFSSKSAQRNDIKHCKLYVNTKISSKFIISFKSSSLIVFLISNLFINISEYFCLGKLSSIFHISFFITSKLSFLIISLLFSSFKLSIKIFMIFSFFSINSQGLF